MVKPNLQRRNKPQPKQRPEESRSKRIVSWIVVATILFGIWYFILPPSLGGKTLLLTTRGISMQPLLHQGDLAILRKQSTYKVGDVVQYHSTAINAPVLHRIISAENGTYSTQGDNNNFVDLDHPSTRDINGKMIKSFKGLGNKIGWIKSLPARIVGAVLVGIAVYGLFANRNKDEEEASAKKKTRRTLRPPGRSKREEIDASVIEAQLRGVASTPNEHAPQGPPTAALAASRATRSGEESIALVDPPPGGLQGDEDGGPGATNGGLASRGVNRLAAIRPRAVHLPSRAAWSRLGLGVFGVIAAVSIVFTVVAFRHPVSEAKDQVIFYTMKGSFDYTAQATGGDVVYRDGLVRTGDPIYLAMVRQLSVSFQFELDSPSRFNGGGTVQLDVVLKGASGWSHPVGVAEVLPFEARDGRATALINIEELQSIIRQVSELTRVADSSFTLTISPRIVAKGSLGGQKLDTTFTPSLDMTFNNSIMKPPAATAEAANGAASPAGPEGLNEDSAKLSGLEVKQNGQLAVAAGTPQHLRTLGGSVAVVTLRMISVGGLLIGVLGIALCLRRRAGAQSDGIESEEFDAIRHHAEEVQAHQRLFVPVSGLQKAAIGQLLVEVDSLDDLARIADNHEALIFQEQDNDREIYAVTHGGITYRYCFAPKDFAKGASVNSGDVEKRDAKSVSSVVTAQQDWRTAAAGRRKAAQNPNRRFRVRESGNEYHSPSDPVGDAGQPVAPEATATPAGNPAASEVAVKAPQPRAKTKTTKTKTTKTKTAKAEVPVAEVPVAEAPVQDSEPDSTKQAAAAKERKPRKPRARKVKADAVEAGPAEESAASPEVGPTSDTSPEAAE